MSKPTRIEQPEAAQAGAGQADIGNRATRHLRIQQALGTLSPTHLEVIDESHKHVGHAGARDGRGHFAVVIVCEAFAGLAPIARHRRVYDALGTMMQTDIHALSIKAFASLDAAHAAGAALHS